MTIFEIYRRNQEIIDSLYLIQRELLTNLCANGHTWQTLVFIDKIAAIRLYKEQNNCSLFDSKTIVEAYLVSQSKMGESKNDYVN